MADFPLCEAFQEEYGNPYDRRFHAQPLACECCGPILRFHSQEKSVEGNEAALTACVEALRRGEIIAVKGIGGYHLMCDASNQRAVALLRQRKNRPEKPLAVLFPWQGPAGTEHVLNELQADEQQLAALTHPARSIVLVEKRSDSKLAENINPGLVEVGAMLPYSPLHYLISQDFSKPLVATSGNISGEPVLTDNDEAQQRLAPIVDGFLHHNRPILRPADDSVQRIIHHQPRFLRLGRGSAPLELELPFRLRLPLLAVGGHMKNTVALAWQRRLVMSPHIGDLSSVRSMAVFEQVIEDLQNLYDVYPQHIVCDRHPEYANHRWARHHCQETFKQLIEVFHHHAHAGALCGEYPQEQRWLVFTWDGTGYGEDANIWGGESFLGRAGDWRRVSSFRPLSIVGGDAAALQPWRSAAALCWEQGVDWRAEGIDHEFALQAWRKRQNCFETSAVGRLFDAASCLITGLQQCSFDGQAPMQLEQLANPLHEDAIHLPMTNTTDALLRVDWSPLLPMLLNRELSQTERASMFHSSMAISLLNQALHLRERHGDFAVGLSGGVFQNKKLTEFVIRQLQSHDFRAYLNLQIPSNDAGISYGQIIEAHKNHLT
jgi:hydrogenase maturation protein HypF